MKVVAAYRRAMDVIFLQSEKALKYLTFSQRLQVIKHLCLRA